MDLKDRIYALSSIWMNAKDVFPYFGREEFDWDEAYRKFIPQLLEERGDLEVWLTLMEFTRLLNDGHSTVIPPKALTLQYGVFPFRLMQLGGRFVITEAVCEDHLLREALGIDEYDMRSLLEMLDRLQYTSNGHPYCGRLEKQLPLLLPGKTHVLHTDAGDIPFTMESPGEMKRAPEPAASETPTVLSDEVSLFGGGILCVKTSDFQHPERADRFSELLSLHKPKAVIFDVRRNIGGMTLCSARYAQPFFVGSLSGCRKWTQERKGCDAAEAAQLARMSDSRLDRLVSEGLLTREGVEQSRSYINRTHYAFYCDNWEGAVGFNSDRPVIVLASRDTISAAEDFVCFFKSNARGKIMGEPTFGSTGSPLVFRLPEGGLAQIVSVGYTLLDGTPFIGKGIEPDIPLTPDIGDFRAGRDTLLEKALETARSFV